VKNKKQIVGALLGAIAGGATVVTTYTVPWASIWPLYDRGPSPYTMYSVGSFFGGWYEFAPVAMDLGGAILLIGAACALWLRGPWKTDILSISLLGLGSVIIAYTAFHVRGSSTSSSLFMGVIWHRGPGLWICSLCALLGLLGTALVASASFPLARRQRASDLLVSRPM
jgi:hypothetical protein